LEHLSDASFLGKLLVLPANVKTRLKRDCHEHSSFIGLVISNEGKKFYNLDARSFSPSKMSSETIDNFIAQERMGVPLQTPWTFW